MIKKNILLLSVFFITFPLLAQIRVQKPDNLSVTNNKAWSFQAKGLRSTVCNPDTLLYPLFKGTVFSGFLMGADWQVFGWGQYYDAPQEITIQGFVFHAFLDSITAQTAPITCNIYLAGADSFPSGSPLETVTVNIDSSMGPFVEDFAYEAIFQNPVMLTDPYVITVEYSGTMDVVVLSNDNGDGLGENLSSLKFNGNWFTGREAEIDVDILLHPIVEAALTADFNVSSACVDSGKTILFSDNSSPILKNRMYNAAVFFDFDEFSYTWNFDDGTMASGQEALHAYTATGTAYNVVLTDTLFGWTQGLFCVDKDTMVLSALELTTLSTDEDCGVGNGSVDLSVNGNVGNVMFNWSNGETTQNISNLSPAVYSVTVTDDNTCSAVAWSAVSSITGPVVTVDSVDHLNCFGDADGRIKVSITNGDPPYSVIWSTGASDTTAISELTAGTYTLTVTDNLGCKGSDFIRILQPDTIGISGVVNDNAGIGDIELTTWGGTGNFSFEWSTGATSQNLDSISTQEEYTVTVTDDNGCTNTRTFTVGGIVKVTEFSKQAKLVVYPNPSEGRLYIRGIADLSSYELYIINLIGQKVYSESVNGNNKDLKYLELNNLKEGIYLLHIAGGRYQETHRLIIR